MRSIDKCDTILSELEENNLSDSTLRNKYIRLKRILERSCKDITIGESLQFSSLFSRLVFISQKYDLPRSVEWNLQNIRVKGSFLLQADENIVSQLQYDEAYKTITNFISIIYNRVGETVRDIPLTDDIVVDKPLDIRHHLRVQVVDTDRDNELIKCEVSNVPGSSILLKYNVKGINDSFNTTIDHLWNGAQLNLIECKINESGQYIPKFIVLEPDYLIDTSAMAECFQNYGRSYLHYFRRKFEQTANSQYILLGNLANYFLDELVFAEDPESLNFNEVFLESFKQKPFEYTSCNDIRQVEDFRMFMVKARTQFNNIKRVITNDLSINQIDINNCILEPSFFCEKFGFQGRLDLLQLSDDNNSKPHKIIELKSGSLPFPKDDPGKISINHEVQTTIYRLIIQSVFKVDDRGVSASILYSAAENPGENLRLAATYRALEKEIVNMRNLIVATEHDLYSGDSEVVEKLFTDICNTNNYGRIPDFFAQRLADFEKVLKNTTELEKAYFFRYITFLSRELYIQKVGNDHFESAHSTASLWNTEFAERCDTFDLIPDLEIIEIDESGRDMKILFKRNDTSDFINFREGEICILYPHEEYEDNVLTYQILKGTIAEITHTHILLRFRYKQKNQNFFQRYTSWVVEHDRLDHAYNNMYKSLYMFLRSPVDKRSLLLGKKKPDSYLTSADYTNNNISLDIHKKQEQVINKAIEARDYFLIVGPPGTGKTSVFARRLIEHYYNNTHDNILIIAYTNRAVDELCEAINQAFGCDDCECDQYIRIGTELSCGENYRHRLLQNIADQVKNREELRDIIKSQRIFIGTLAAITGKPEIFDIKKFNISIIDEASQILEPQIIGLLPQVDKFIMIGDHKQLSTITLQDTQKACVMDPVLNIIELYNCSESLFERLFRLCQKNGWEHTYDTLIYQGRMHCELANFPNKYFYNNLLKPISEWQNNTLAWAQNDNCDIYQNLICENRQAFINCMDNNNSLSDKVNYKEAEIVVSLSKAIIELYENNGLEFATHKTLGIITPYRNQIALIKHKLFETGIDLLQNVMVDTVERFQGSQRDFIILSFCMNKPYQLDFFSNMNIEKTVDRKLNVTITRARQQLFLVGNEYILRQNQIYRTLLDSLPKYDLSDI
ncbi:AAA domain-containing protein [Dysgonomonas sp. OttesenSCG-928-M03]|nr:AAA domain-containing protein [Dysgonomonas sp. OttesenSCG-928-M03]